MNDQDLTSEEFFYSLDNWQTIGLFEFAELYAEYKMRLTNDMLPERYHVIEEG